MTGPEEKTEFAYENPRMFSRTFIPSQIIKNKEKEVIIINFEGSVIEVFRTDKDEEPLTVFIDGSLVATVAKNEKRKFEISTSGNTHEMYVWNARAKGFFFSNFIWKNGIAVTIDDIPVKDTLADPLKILIEGKVGVYIFLALMALKMILTTFIYNSAGLEDEALGNAVLYGAGVLMLIVAAAIFKVNPRTALWIGIIIGAIETVDFIGGALMSGRLYNIIIWGSLRVGCLFAMGRTMKEINKILKIKLPEKAEFKNEVTEDMTENTADGEKRDSRNILNSSQSNLNVSKDNNELRFRLRLKTLPQGYYVFFSVWGLINLLLLLMSKNLEVSFFEVNEGFFPLNYLLKNDYYYEFSYYLREYDITELVTYLTLPFILFYLYDYLRIKGLIEILIKYKRRILLAAIVIAAIFIGIKYGLPYYKEQKSESLVSEAIGLKNKMDKNTTIKKEKIREIIDEAIKLNPENKQAYIEKIKIMPRYKYEDAEEVIKIYENKLEYYNEGTDADYFYVLATAYRNMDNDAKAEKFYHKSAKIYKEQNKMEDYYNAVNGLCYTYIKQNRYNEAEYLLKKVIKYNQEEESAYTFLGLLYSNQDKRDSAILYLNKAIEKTPSWEAPYRIMALVYRNNKIISKGDYYDYNPSPNDRKELEKARKYINEAIKVGAEFNTYLVAAEIEFALGNRNKGCEYLEKVHELVDKKWKEYYYKLIIANCN